MVRLADKPGRVVFQPVCHGLHVVGLCYRG